MDNVLFAVGNIIYDKKNKKKYRVISIINKYVIMCEMDITKLCLYNVNIDIICNLISSKELEIVDENNYIFDINMLSDRSKKRFFTKKNIMNEIIRIYGPTYEGLLGKKSKLELIIIIKNNPLTTEGLLCYTLDIKRKEVK